MHKFLAELLDVVWCKEESGIWAIVKLQIKDHENKAKIGNVVYAKGRAYPRHIGVIYEVTGVPEYNKKFSRYELAIASWNPTEEISEKGLIRYLAEEGPDIGEARARKLVSVFGERTLEFLENHPDQLVEHIDGITWERATALQRWRQAEGKNTKIKQQLYSLGLTTHLVYLILGHFGSEASERLPKECFTLTELYGIGFLTCCKIANRLGIPKEDPGRIKAGILHAFKTLIESNGSTCIPYDRLITASCKLIGVGKRSVADMLHKLIKDEELVTQAFNPANFYCNRELMGLSNGNETDISQKEISHV